MTHKQEKPVDWTVLWFMEFVAIESHEGSHSHNHLSAFKRSYVFPMQIYSPKKNPNDSRKIISIWSQVIFSCILLILQERNLLQCRFFASILQPYFQMSLNQNNQKDRSEFVFHPWSSCQPEPWQQGAEPSPARYRSSLVTVYSPHKVTLSLITAALPYLAFYCLFHWEVETRLQFMITWTRVNASFSLACISV